MARAETRRPFLCNDIFFLQRMWFLCSVGHHEKLWEEVTGPMSFHVYLLPGVLTHAAHTWPYCIHMLSSHHHVTSKFCVKNSSPIQGEDKSKIYNW